MEVADEPAVQAPGTNQRIAGDAVWLVTLRWMAIGGQLTTIAAVVALLKTPLPLGKLLTVIAFAHAQSVLIWISGIALLGYLADYYYALDQTLLVKSVALVLMGVALLLARVLHRRRWSESEAVA